MRLQAPACGQAKAAAIAAGRSAPVHAASVRVRPLAGLSVFRSGRLRPTTRNRGGAAECEWNQCNGSSSIFACTIHASVANGDKSSMAAALSTDSAQGDASCDSACTSP